MTYSQAIQAQGKFTPKYFTVWQGYSFRERRMRKTEDVLSVLRLLKNKPRSKN